MSFWDRIAIANRDRFILWGRVAFPFAAAGYLYMLYVVAEGSHPLITAGIVLSHFFMGLGQACLADRRLEGQDE